jgi:indolepyruvate ferredoxin oxidoreductase beta subunit
MNLQSDPFNLIICGVGGQGNILISRLIARALANKEYYVTIGETFGAAQRGGAVHSSLRISRKKYYGPLIPEGNANLILSLEPLETLRLLQFYGNPDIITLTNSQPLYPVGVLAKRLNYPDIDKLKDTIRKLSQKSFFFNAAEKAIELGSPIITNIIMLGALISTKQIPLSIEEVELQIKNTFADSKANLNVQALSLGFNSI